MDDIGFGTICFAMYMYITPSQRRPRLAFILVLRAAPALRLDELLIRGDSFVIPCTAMFSQSP